MFFQSLLKLLIISAVGGTLVICAGEIFQWTSTTVITLCLLGGTLSGIFFPLKLKEDK